MDVQVVLFAAAVVFGAAAFALTFRTSPAGPALNLIRVLLLAGVWWSLWGLALVHAATRSEALTAYLWLEIGLAIGAATVPAAAVAMTQPERLHSPWLWSVLAVDPLFVLLVFAEPEWQSMLVRATAYRGGRAWLEPGPLMWIHAALASGLVLAAAALLLSARRASVLGQRSRYVVFAIAVAVPGGGAFVVLAVTRDVVNVALAASAGLMVVSLALMHTSRGLADRLRSVRVVDVVGALGDAILVVDDSGVVLMSNPAAREVAKRWGIDLLAAVGQSLPDLALVDAFGASQLVKAPDGTVFDVRVVSMVAGTRVITARDVTEVERLRAELAEQVERDGLTAVHNRRRLDRVLPGLVAEAAIGRPVVAAMLDIDHFKQVNDRHGHAAGDRVLTGLAQHLVTKVRDTETLVRFGGEEFLFIVPHMTLNDMVDRLEEIRRECEALTFDTEAGPISITVSFGVAQARPGYDIDDLLRRADAALYRAKAEGRNRVVTDALVPSPRTTSVPATMTAAVGDRS